MGPLGFIAIFGSIIGGLTLFVERKVGKSLQVGDYSLLKGAGATVVAFGIAMGFLFLLIFLGRL